MGEVYIWPAAPPVCPECHSPAVAGPRAWRTYSCRSRVDTVTRLFTQSDECADRDGADR